MFEIGGYIVTKTLTRKIIGVTDQLLKFDCNSAIMISSVILTPRYYYVSPDGMVVKQCTENATECKATRITAQKLAADLKSRTNACKEIDLPKMTASASDYSVDSVTGALTFTGSISAGGGTFAGNSDHSIDALSYLNLLEKEETMSDAKAANVSVTVEKQLLVNGVNIYKASSAQLVALIVNLENHVQYISGIRTESKYLDNEVELLQSAIRKIAKELDSRV